MKNLKIKMACMELDMSQEEISKKLGATRQTIRLIEAGRYNQALALYQYLYCVINIWMIYFG